MLSCFNRNATQFVSKLLLQVEKLNRLYLCPGSASVSFLAKCVFSGELWGHALNREWTGSFGDTKSLAKAGLCLQDK